LSLLGTTDHPVSATQTLVEAILAQAVTGQAVTGAC